MDRIAIIGLGLIGTSLGLAIRQAMGREVEVVGTDLELDHIVTAKKMGAIDRDERSIPSAVQGANIVMLATPILAMRDLLEFLGPYLAEGSVVTDTGSTKKDVVAWGEQLLPAGVSFVGGHPMAGKEASGPDEAEAALLQGAVYAICPAPSAAEEATKAIAGLVQAIGAKPYFVDPAEHDSYVAAVSHLPFLLSICLVNTTTKSPSWRDMSRLAANGYRDISRLASGDPVMHRDIALTNRDAMVHWLDEFIKDLHGLRNLVKDDPEGLEKALVDAWEARARWLLNRESEEPLVGEGIKASDFTMTMFLGDHVAKKFKKLGQERKQDPTRYRKS